MRFRDQEKKKAVTFSYDDGITQDIRLIELLNKYDLKCTFNLNSGRLSERGMLNRNGLRISHYKVHKEDAKAIYEGHEVAAHTLTHKWLPKCDDEEVIRQVEVDRQNLSELVGYEVVGMAYASRRLPLDDTRVVDLIRNNTGIKYCRNVPATGNFELQKDLYRYLPTAYHLDFDQMMELGREFLELEPQEPKIFSVWGHSYEMDYGADYWVRLEEFFKLISHRDDIFYGTNREVYL